MLASAWKAGIDIQESRAASRCGSTQAAAQHVANYNNSHCAIGQRRPTVGTRQRVRSMAWLAFFRHFVEPLGPDVGTVRPDNCSSLQEKLPEVRRLR
jgi:hypothetical protein